MKAHTIVVFVVVLVIVITVGVVVVSKGKKADNKGTTDVPQEELENKDQSDTQQETTPSKISEKKNMKISSPAFQDNQKLPTKYTCDGESVNPPLTIADVPEDAKSLALILEDPDAPSGLFVHWIVFNIDPKTSSIEENSIPKNAVEGTTSYNSTGYGVPCPPSGTHRYTFKLYALVTKLELPSSVTRDALINTMNGHIVANAELVGLYR